MSTIMKSRELYKTQVVPAIMEEFGITNVNAVPRIEKISLNMGVGKAIDDAKMLDAARKEMSMIAGQTAAVTQARIAVSNFRLRQGYRIGCRVTLREKRMYDFLDKFIHVACPSIRDFRGLKDTSFDKQGNYSIGVEEISIFPEVDQDRMEYSFGMDITIVIRNSTGPEMSRRFLQMMGMPFVNREVAAAK